MKRGVLLIGLALLVAACGRDQGVALRYRAERDLWRANWEYRRLAIRPQDVGAEQWLALADEYEAIADRSMRALKLAADGRARRDGETVAARALFSAARVHELRQDPPRVEAVYRKMADEFAHLPDVASEVALARGAIAERRGDLLQAADFYGVVVDRVAPELGEATVAGAVIDLPLHIARLRARGAAGQPSAPYYADARAYYERLVREHAGERLQYESQARLTEISADLGDWTQAIEALRLLETQLRASADPPREPCEVRFAIGGLQTRAGIDPAVIRATLLSVLEDYPDCRLTAQVLMALAENAQRRDQTEEALGYLQEVVDKHRADEDAASQALLARGTLLESQSRWSEALETFRTLSVVFPITPAALAAPIEIAAHYSRLGDEAGTASALAQAERKYRDFIAKYPPGTGTLEARQRLVQVLMLRKEYGPAVQEMEDLGRDLTGTPQGASILVAAARTAYAELGDTARAAAILARTGELYANADVGRWASGEAARLNGTVTR